MTAPRFETTAPPAQYVVGIDLGTTNCVLMYAPLDEPLAKIERLPIPQWVDSGVVEALPRLASFLYLADGSPSAGLGHSALDLPWQAGAIDAAGEMARRRAAEEPQRTVGGAKSWLCHHQVDRHQALLPWNAPADVSKISPVTASCRYLQHLAGAWQTAFPDAPLANQHVVLTVPASFDASARDLTREAALAAGLSPHLVLLEEPQAAIYSYLASSRDGWRETMKVDDLLLVCDVGGGTTDFTLVRVTADQGELSLQRIAVGSHLLVGGDNMDLTLAHRAAEQFSQQGIQLDPWQSVALWHSCRNAKEALFAIDGPTYYPLSILGRGSRLIGGTVSIELSVADATNILLDGFFPHCEPTDRPARRRVSGFRELGLPYESDPAITRHLAAFLQAHAAEGERILHPTRLLLNGGVFKAPALRARLQEVLAHWAGDQAPAPITLDDHEDLDDAVARGAAYYGWSKCHGGVRIRGGTARSYYVGIETAGLAIPGASRPLRALCVVPFGMEEGTEQAVPSAEIGLVVGEPAQFQFFSSSVRRHDQLGDTLERWSEDELSETDPLETILPADELVAGSQAGTYVPIRFLTRITELGVLELWCVNTPSDRRWKLEFNVRPGAH